MPETLRDHKGRKWVMTPITDDDCGMFDGEPCSGEVKNRGTRGDGDWVALLIYCDAHWAKCPENPDWQPDEPLGGERP